MKAKKILAGMLALTMSMGVLAGCGGSNDSSKGSSGKKDSKGGTTLEVLTHRTDLEQNGKLAEMTKAFEEANDCTVQYVSYTNYADDVSTRMSTSDYGDVLMIPDSVKLADLGNFFEPLGTYDEMKEEWDCIDSKMYDNTVYGIPTALNLAGGVLYNKQVFADAGIDTLPTTPDEFVADLQKIADNCEGVIPLYTNFSDSWTLAQWQGLVVSASGDPSYEVNLLKDKTDLFAEGGAYYEVYKMMYDIMSNKALHEEDPTSTDWEGCKPALAQGKIGTLVLGSWAVAQFRTAAEEAGADPDNIGYMPMPANVDGTQYAQISADYCMGVNKNSDSKELAEKYIKWYCGESGLQTEEMAICAKKGSALPEFMNGVSTFVKDPEPAEYEGKFNEIDKTSEVGTWDTDTANFKVKLCEAAFAGEGDEAFNKIIKDTNEKWNAARDSVLG